MSKPKPENATPPEDRGRRRFTKEFKEEAVWSRQPGAGLIHHSDQGGQYASKEYRSVLRRAGMRQSMSGAGNCCDNAFMESCFGTIKTELVDYADGHEAARELRQYVSYNLERRHSSFGYDTPTEFESQPSPQTTVPD